jgi:hypothetical protein
MLKKKYDLYDALTEEDGLICQWEAMWIVIRKAGFDN